MQKNFGKKVWLFADGELPPEGDYALKGHESIIILNTSSNDAHIKMTLYFDNKEPIENVDVLVKAKRVRCLRTNVSEDMGGVEIPREMQYSMEFISDTPITIQYGRLDTRNQPMAFYNSTGYCE